MTVTPGPPAGTSKSWAAGVEPCGWTFTDADDSTVPESY